MSEGRQEQLPISAYQCEGRSRFLWWRRDCHRPATVERFTTIMDTGDAQDIVWRFCGKHDPRRSA